MNPMLLERDRINSWEVFSFRDHGGYDTRFNITGPSKPVAKRMFIAAEISQYEMSGHLDL